MYLYNWWSLTKRRVHQREVEVAFSGQRVAAERHGDLLHRDLEAGRRERLDEDVGRPTDSSKRGRAVGCHRMYQRQRRLVRSEERSDDAAAVAADNRSLIDLQGYDSPGGRRLHAGGQGLPADAPRPEIDPSKGTLDHLQLISNPTTRSR